MPSLAGPFLKLDRALAHIQALNAEVAALRFRLCTNPSPVRVDRDVQTGEYLIRLNPIEQPPPEWSPWIGEIVHDMRSALDHLVWQLACVKVGDPDRTQPLADFWGQLQFPIYDKKPKNSWEAAVVNRLHNVDKAPRDGIRDHQPYVRMPADPASDLLARLAKLSNIDKHQTLHIVSHFVWPSAGPLIELEPTDCTINDRWDRPAGVVGPDKILTRFSVAAAGPKPQVKVKTNLLPDVALEEPSPLDGWEMPLTMALVSIRGRVEEVVLAFAGLFPKDEQRSPLAVVLNAWPSLPPPDPPQPLTFEVE